MYLMFLGLLCLSVVSFGRADISFAKKQSETTDEMKALFSLMDAQIEKDGQITFDEFKQAFLQWDSNGDEGISESELNAVLKKLNFGYSKMADYLFSTLNLSELEEWFELVDSDLDGAIVMSEYENAYADYDLVDK